MSNKTSDKNVANIEIIEDFIFELKSFGLNKDTLEVANELEKLLAEREQKDKRIKELEELVAKLKTVDYMFRIDSYSNRVDMRRIYFEWLDSIPKQAVIDELKRLSDMLNKTTEGRIQKYTVNEIIIRSNTLKELLEGEK